MLTNVVSRRKPGELKAVFVDGASAHHTKPALGIAFYNCRGLFNVLVNCVGIYHKTAFPPLVTMNPDMACRHKGLAKDFSGAGFEIIPVTTGRSADDEAIKCRIRMLDPAEVGEIVIFTSDKDFVPVLRQKAQEGISVHWVSTCRCRPGEKHSALSSDVVDLCHRHVFNFVELAAFSGNITDKKLAPNATPSARPQKDDFTQATMKLRSPDPMEHLRFADELRRLQRTFKGLSLSIDA